MADPLTLPQKIRVYAALSDKVQLDMPSKQARAVAVVLEQSERLVSEKRADTVIIRELRTHVMVLRIVIATLTATLIIVSISLT